MKKLFISFVLLFSLFVFSQEYQFDYMLNSRSISNDYEGASKHLIYSKNVNVSIFFYDRGNEVYARLLD
ncbi:hypothetical protein [Cloacibacterium sp. TD35]|uniref:hypothetical protein n=1 Tax=Cloacibacterium sp. TD35 TaxID=2976818 RepID=UPI00237D6E7B|nr:hypothetical protein [Cloacibacterium sp. TD35]WDT67547.1 hypothetical protein N7277_09430 [Cloacibacterium sp. TD35]